MAPEEEEFIRKCISLENIIKSLGSVEESPRVWTAVLCNFMKFFINTSGNRTKALQQVIKSLKEKI